MRSMILLNDQIKKRLNVYKIKVGKVNAIDESGEVSLDNDTRWKGPETAALLRKRGGKTV